MKTRPNTRYLFLIFVIYLSFIALGLPDTGFGVAWNAMWPEFGVSLANAGLVTMVITIASAISGFLAGWFLNRFGTGMATVISCFLTAFASLGFAISPNFGTLLLFAFPLGLGAGAVDTGLNTYVAQHLSAKHMNWLHGAWGLGATLSPFILTATIVSSNWRVGYFGIGLILIIVSLIIWLSLPLWHSVPRQKTVTEVVKEHIPSGSKLAVILSITSFMLYVAVEMGIGVWLSALWLESRGVGVAYAGAMVSLYYGALTAGRFLFGAFANRLGNRQSILIGMSIASFGGLLLTLQSFNTLATLGVFLLGLGFAPVYPSLMHETMSRFPQHQAQKVISNQVAFSYISLLVCVPLIGWLATVTFLEIIPWLALGIIGLLWAVIISLNILTNHKK